eukprot:scaffold2414_cov164-Ochromonas_danica.AAC.1
MDEDNFHEDSGFRRSGRVRHSVERYDDLAERERKRKMLEKFRPRPRQTPQQKEEGGWFGQEFFSKLDKHTQHLHQNFRPPMAWVEELSSNEDGRRSSREEAQQEDGIPPYRHLRQNLYRAPLCRPGFDWDEDAMQCNCHNQGGKCNEHCVNRTLFM